MLAKWYIMLTPLNMLTMPKNMLEVQSWSDAVFSDLIGSGWVYWGLS